MASRVDTNRPFRYLDPTYPTLVSGSVGGSISIILGTCSGSYIDSQSVISGSVDSISSSLFYIAGIGFKVESPYKDTLFDAEELWIPIQTADSIEVIKFEVDERSNYDDWVYLWTDATDPVISGSWVAGGFSLAEDPYEEYSGSMVVSSLDYSCVVPGPGNIIFVYYIPDGFEFHGDYNALLNNAMSQSNEETYLSIDNGVITKKYVADDHKPNAVGGIYAGNYIHLSAEVTKDVQQKEYVSQFGSASVQTLDLAFTSYRAISASVYVDRTFGEGTRSVQAPIEVVWDDLQNGNEEKSETVYFVPKSGWVSGSVQLGERSSVPKIGDILFKVQNNNPARYVNATLYAPFINTVFRTDDFGFVTGTYSGPQE